MIRNNGKYMYEKYEIVLARPYVEGTNKLSRTHDSVKQMKQNYILRSTWIELWVYMDRTSFKVVVFS